MSEGMLDARPAQAEKAPAAGAVQMNIAGEPILCEASGDYTLPDYQPEIRKILHVRPAILPTGKFLSGGRAEFSGTVAHSVLYADADGRLAAALLPGEYSFRAELPAGEDAVVLSDSMAEGTVCRPGGPRKLTLRTRVRSALHILREESVSPDIRGMGAAEDEASMERLTGRYMTMVQAGESSPEFTMTDTVRLEENGADLHAVWSGGNLLVNECRVQEGGCLCRGDAWVRSILAPAEGTPYTVRTKIPFEVSVPVEGMAPSACAVAYGRLVSVDVSIVPGADGEGGSLVFDAVGEVEVLTAANRQTEGVVDLYSTAYEMNCRYHTVPLCRFLGCSMGNYTVSGARPRGECEARNAVTVVDADGRIEIDEMTNASGRAVVSGRVMAQMIFLCEEEGGETTLQCAEIPVPFRVETDLRPECDGRVSFECHGELIAVRGRIEPNALAADAEIALTLIAAECTEVRLLAEAEPDRSVAVEHAGNRVRVYYPQEHDTLFSVAARYHKKRAAIARTNDIGEEALAASDQPWSLDGIHHLLIED